MISILSSYHKLWLGNPRVEGPPPRIADGDHLEMGTYSSEMFKCHLLKKIYLFKKYERHFLFASFS